MRLDINLMTLHCGLTFWKSNTFTYKGEVSLLVMEWWLDFGLIHGCIRNLYLWLLLFCLNCVIIRTSLLHKPWRVHRSPLGDGCLMILGLHGMLFGRMLWKFQLTTNDYSVIWLIGKSGKFSVKSVYNALTKSSSRACHKRIWKGKIPEKIKFSFG